MTAASEAGQQAGQALTAAERQIHTAMANAVSRLAAGTVTPLQARKAVRLDTATALGNASRRIRQIHAKAATEIGGSGAVLPSAPGQVDTAVLTAQHDADVAFRAILAAYTGGEHGVPMLPPSSRWQKPARRAIRQAKGPGKAAAVLALEAVAAAGFTGYISPAGRRQELAVYGQRVTRAAVRELARLPVAGVIEARREQLLAKHTAAVAAAWKQATTRIDPAAVVAAYRADPRLSSATGTTKTAQAWRKQAAKSAATAALNAVYQSAAYLELVAVLEEMVRDGMAEGEADTLATAAALQQLGPFDIAAAFAAALAMLQADTSISGRAEAAAAGLITAAANALARVLAGHAPGDEDLDDDTREELSGGGTLARFLDWSLWGAFGAGAMALYQRVAASMGEMLLDWTTDSSPCALCQSNADGNPYAPEDVPAYPGHSSCRCSIDPASDVPLSFLAAYLG